MTSNPRRDPTADHLITPQNAALLLIDYQPSQIAAVHSMDPQLMIKNAVSTVKLARTFKLPIVHSTVNVASGRQKPTVPELVEVLGGAAAIDRTTINAWEDAELGAAGRALGRRKLIFCALWTEVCMAFPALDALLEGYEIYPVVDAIGGTSAEAHRAGLDRVVQAGKIVRCENLRHAPTMRINHDTVPVSHRALPLVSGWVGQGLCWPLGAP